MTSNLPFNEWTEILGSERMTGALLDRLTHHVHILEMTAAASGSSRARSGALTLRTELGRHTPNSPPPWSQAGFHCAFSRPDGRPQAAFQPAPDHPNRGILLLLQMAYSHGATLVYSSGALDKWSVLEPLPEATQVEECSLDALPPVVARPEAHGDHRVG